MLNVRSFRNEDPPRLLELWQKTQQRKDIYSPLFPLSLNQLQSQILGLPMLDNRAVLLAFDDNALVGYVHTAFAPSEDRNSFDYTVGQICFLCVDPKYHDIPGASAALICSAEKYLSESGAKKIYGGSPSPSAPFYTGFYGGSEALGILRSDQTAVNAFQAANYNIENDTVWFHLDLKNNTLTSPIETITYYSDLMVEIHDISEARTWWEGCIHANGIWFDATLFWTKTNQPIARLRTRISYPDTESFLAMYSGTWFASLMELRVHPDFVHKGVQHYLLDEVINYLGLQKHVVQIEAHAAAGTPLYTLLHNREWQKRDKGFLFVKEL